MSFLERRIEQLGYTVTHNAKGNLIVNMEGKKGYHSWFKYLRGYIGTHGPFY